MDSIGAYLRRERELRHVSLGGARADRDAFSEDAVAASKLGSLRRAARKEVFARGFLRSYARALNLDCEDVLTRFGAGRKVEEPVPAPSWLPVQTPERGRRFGIANRTSSSSWILFYASRSRSSSTRASAKYALSSCPRATLSAESVFANSSESRQDLA